MRDPAAAAVRDPGPDRARTPARTGSRRSTGCCCPGWRPTPLDHALTEPLLVVMAQGGKRLLLGDQVHEYRAGAVPGRHGRTAGHGPLPRRQPGAAGPGPGLVLRPAAIAPLLLEMPAVPRSRSAQSPPAMATGPASAELLDAMARLLRLLDHPADAPVLAPADRAGDPLAPAHRPARRHGRPDRSRRQRPVPRQPGHRLDPRQLRRTDAGRRPGPAGPDEPVRLPPALPRGHGHEPAAVPEAHPAAGGPHPAGLPAGGRGRRRAPGRLRQPDPVQPRVPPPVRRPARPGRRRPPCRHRPARDTGTVPPLP